MTKRVIITDSDIFNIIQLAKRYSSNNIITKAMLMKAFYQYYNTGRKPKVETFLRKIRYYASSKIYIEYVKGGVYKVIV